MSGRIILALTDAQAAALVAVQRRTPDYSIPRRVWHSLSTKGWIATEGGELTLTPMGEALADVACRLAAPEPPPCDSRTIPLPLI